MTAPDAAARAERVMVWAVCFFRIGGLLQIVIAVTLSAHVARTWQGSAILAAVVTAESVVLVAATIRARALRPGWVSADLAFSAAGLVAGAWLTAPQFGHSWAFFMYPFTLISAVGLGMAYRRATVAFAAATVLAATYMAAAIAFHHDPVWNVTPNAVSYYANVLVAWAVARQLRRTARDADAASVRALDQARELAAERERSRHARLLHDRVLQTVETLARNAWIADADMRDHVVTEAAWLRALVEGVPLDEHDDLLPALESVVERKSRTGLRIEFNRAQLREPGRVSLAPVAVHALAAATNEALTNVAKHAGVDAATVRTAVSGQQVVVSVLDHGRGFDPGTARHGLGIDLSIRAQLEEAGGTVRIDSAPGSGTYVEMMMPVEVAVEPPASTS